MHKKSIFPVSIRQTTGALIVSCGAFLLSGCGALTMKEFESELHRLCASVPEASVYETVELGPEHYDKHGRLIRSSTLEGTTVGEKFQLKYVRTLLREDDGHKLERVDTKVLDSDSNRLIA